MSLVAASAGATAALNAYAKSPSTIHSVTLICGQILGTRTHVGPSIYAANTSFAESADMLEQSLKSLTNQARARIISIHPIYDETVPIADAKVPGARVRTIPVMGHAIGIGYAITLGARRIVRDSKR